MGKSVAVIICAAGSSERFGGKKNKPFVDVGGRAAFLRSVELFTERDDVKQVLMAISATEDEMFNIKWGAKLIFFGVKVYHGGTERWETVQKGLDLVKDDIDLVAVHDAARCCITGDLVDKVFAKAANTGAALPANPVIGTVKHVENEQIVKTVDRSCLYEAQTPQTFAKDLLKRAYTNLKNLDSSTISDDAQLVEALGEKVHIVTSDPTNMKITYPADAAIAEAIIKSRPKPKPEGPMGPYNEAQW
ncbi:2-C-methyl-D-erythritol 4-phosphate cytidylyltransferase [Planctomycetota bacterium]